MKINQITEATIENMELLEELSEMILSLLPPDGVDTDSKLIISGTGLENAIRKIIGKFKEKNRERVLYKLAYFDIVFKNYTSEIAKGYGYVDFNTEEIGVNLARAFKSADFHSTPSIQSNKFVKSTLVHELRHMFQFTEYPKYFYKHATSDVNYTENKYEIDASWHHLLNENDPTKYRIPKKYAEKILGDLMLQKKINDREYAHYYKKTINYYYIKNRTASVKSLTDIANQYYDYYNPANAKDFINELLDFWFGQNYTSPSNSNTEYNLLKNIALQVYKERRIKK